MTTNTLSDSRIGVGGCKYCIRPRSKVASIDAVFTASGVFNGCHRAVRIDMAAAGAVTQVTCAVAGIRVFVLFMRPGFEVTGMTGCTVGLVLRCLPGYGLGITLVARGAGQVAAMVAWIGPGGMPEGVRCPAVGVMAGIALQAGDEMIARFPGRLGAVVTARTGTGDAVVVEGCWQPCTRRVTGIALCTGLDMIDGLACCGRAVMAAGATAG